MKNLTLATLHHFFMVLAIVAVASSQAGKGSSEFQPNATPSEKAAAENLKRAAESGSAEAQSELSKAYMQGNVFRPNLQEAFRWVRVAAEQGLAEAEVDLGILYLEGQGVPRDYTAGFSWMRS